MNIKCCKKIQKPRLKFSANMSDFIGLSTLLLIMFCMVGFLVYGVGEAALEGLTGGSTAEEFQSCYENDTGRRRISGCIVTSSLFLSLMFISAIIYLLPKALNACGYLINYRLTIKTECSICKKQKVICDLPNISTEPKN
ncbi:hypothetical protein SAMN05216214_1412 [Atopomonas hussainii]|uniref:Uncharacterized protein n=1 Tax=Atopomonas hussainii TaxID=1429083 RepID=A0A1H7TKV8_9GAMM|nr:hypothetical protein SAMN05216214_1412 [Atopomonas hussainii]